MSSLLEDWIQSAATSEVEKEKEFGDLLSCSTNGNPELILVFPIFSLARITTVGGLGKFGLFTANLPLTPRSLISGVGNTIVTALTLLRIWRF